VRRRRRRKTKVLLVIRLWLGHALAPLGVASSFAALRAALVSVKKARRARRGLGIRALSRAGMVPLRGQVNYEYVGHKRGH